LLRLLQIKKNHFDSTVTAQCHTGGWCVSTNWKYLGFCTS